MIRKSTGDISDFDYNKYALPQHKNMSKYLKQYVAPELAAFDIGSSFFRDALWECNFKLLVNSSLDLINSDFSSSDLRKIMSKTKKILEIKYSLKVVRYNPIDIKVITPDS